jgi:transposase
VITKVKLLQEVIKMRFENIYQRHIQRELTIDEAADLLGCSEKTFRRKKIRYEEQGFEGLLDRRLGNKPPNKVAADEVVGIMTLYKEKYYDFTAKHFHEQLVKKHQFAHSYNFVRLNLQKQGLKKNKSRGGLHRKKRARKSMIGMMIHQDASTHQWLEGKVHDLVITMDDATNDVYSAFLIDEEGTNSSFMGIEEVITKHGLFCSLYTDRGSHYGHTPVAGGKVDKSNPTQVARACKQLGIGMIYAYSPEARGRSERMFGSWQNRLPQELRVNNIKDVASANKYIKEVFMPEYNAQFRVKAELEASAFIPYIGRDLLDILSIQEERVVSKDNTVSYKNIILQIPADDYRYHYVKCKVTVNEYYDGRLAIFHGPRKLASYDEKGKMMALEAKKIAS